MEGRGSLGGKVCEGAIAVEGYEFGLECDDLSHLAKPLPGRYSLGITSLFLLENLDFAGL